MRSTGSHKSDDPDKLPLRITYAAQNAVRAEIQSRVLKAALAEGEAIAVRVQAMLAASPTLEALGVELLGFSILAIKPVPETAKALEAEAEGPVAIASIIREYNSINLEEQGFMALILNKFKIRERGLGVTSPDTFHKVGPTPGRDFLLKFASDNGQFNIDKGGLTWRYGKELAKLPKIGTQTMNLRVTEVSYCTQGEECGPGYSGGKQRYEGIHPYLYFQFVADRGPGIDGTAREETNN